MKTAACAFAAVLLLPAPAHAEEADDTAITVTAAKKASAQDAQGLAQAIDAIGAEELANRQVRVLSDLTHDAPGVGLDQVGTFRGVANWSIRGIGINSSIASVDPAVGTFIDGVYLGINPGASLDLFDLGGVEILRGPQGSLYGRNTTGGAVLVSTADPEDHFHAAIDIAADGPVDAGRGAWNMTGTAMVTGPLADGLSFRVAAYRNYDGGYFRNLYNGDALGKADTSAIRGSLAYATGPLKLVLKGEYLTTSGDGAPGQNHGLFSRDSFDVSLDDEGMIRARIRQLTLRADYSFSDGSKLTNIASLRDFRQFANNDIDSTPQVLFTSDTGLTQHQWSDELRWAGTPIQGVELTAGALLFHQAMAYDENRALLSPTPSYFGGGREGHDEQSLFAQGDWHFAPKLTLTAGLGIAREEKQARVSFVVPRNACSAIAGTCPTDGLDGFTDHHRWTGFSPKITLSWAPREGLLAYAGWSRGNRSGGYNLRVTQPLAFLANAAASGSPAYDPERVDSIEVGLKLQSADKKATLNLAAYQTRVKAMQREISVAESTTGLAQSIYNTADARIRGAEAEARFRLTPSLTLKAQAAFIDARYTHVLYDITGDGTIDGADYALALPRVPRWSYGASLAHRLKLGPKRGGAALESRVAFQHTDAQAYTDNDYGWLNAFDDLQADIGLDLPTGGQGGWRLSLYGRNLLDRTQFGGDTQLPFGQGPYSAPGNIARPFGPPAVGSLSPLNKGRVLGVALSARY